MASKENIITSVKRTNTSSASLEYRTLRKCYKILVDHVKQSPSSISAAMFSESYIPPILRDYVGKESALNEEKAQKLVNTMIDRVEYDRTAYYGFLEILIKEGPWIAFVVTEIQECYETLVQESVSFALLDRKDEDSLSIDSFHSAVDEDDCFQQVSSASIQSKDQETKKVHNKSSSTASQSSDSVDSESVNKLPAFVCPFCKSCSVEEFFSKRGCPKATRQISTEDKSLFPYLDTSALSMEDREELEAKLVSNTKDMIYLFADTKQSIVSSMESQDLSIDQVVSYVLSHAMLMTGTGRKHLEGEDETELRNADTITKIFLALHPYTSFFNYEIIERVVIQFGTPDNQEKMKKYVTAFNNFCKRSVFEVPPNVFHYPARRSSERVFAVKFEQENPVILGDIVAVRRKIAEILEIKVGALQLHSIEKGCVLLRFLIPVQVADEIFPVSLTQKTALGRVNVRVIENPMDCLRESDTQVPRSSQNKDHSSMQHGLSQQKQSSPTSMMSSPPQSVLQDAHGLQSALQDAQSPYEDVKPLSCSPQKQSLSHEIPVENIPLQTHASPTLPLSPKKKRFGTTSESSTESVAAFISQVVCPRLSQADINHLVFVQDLPLSYSGRPSLEVLTKLEMLGRYSRHKLDPLSQMMKAIDRHDIAALVDKLQKSKNKRPSKKRPLVEPSQQMETTMQANLEMAAVQTKILFEQIGRLQACFKQHDLKILQEKFLLAVATVEPLSVKIEQVSFMLFGHRTECSRSTTTHSRSSDYEVPTSSSVSFAQSSSSVQALRAFVSQDICQRLNESDVNCLVFLNDLPPTYRNKTALDVFMKLEMMGRYSVHQLDPLLQMMKAINRKDLAKKVDKLGRSQRKKSNKVVAEAHGSTALDVKVKITELQTSLKLNLEQLKELKGSINASHSLTQTGEVVDGLVEILKNFRSALENISSLACSNLPLSRESPRKVNSLPTDACGRDNSSVLAGLGNSSRRRNTVPEGVHKTNSTSRLSNPNYDACNWKFEGPDDKLSPSTPRPQAKIKREATSFTPFTGYDYPARTNLTVSSYREKNDSVRSSNFVGGTVHPGRTESGRGVDNSKSVHCTDGKVSTGGSDLMVSSDLTGGSELTGGSDFTGGSGDTSTGDSGFVDAKRYLKNSSQQHDSSRRYASAWQYTSFVQEQTDQPLSVTSRKQEPLEDPMSAKPNALPRLYTSLVPELRDVSHYYKSRSQPSHGRSQHTGSEHYTSLLEHMKDESHYYKSTLHTVAEYEVPTGPHVTANEPVEMTDSEPFYASALTRLERNKVIALYDYEAQGDQELSLEEGDIVVVLEKEDDLWWCGLAEDGRQGMFPSTYVEPL